MKDNEVELATYLAKNLELLAKTITKEDIKSLWEIKRNLEDKLKDNIFENINGADIKALNKFKEEFKLNKEIELGYSYSSFYYVVDKDKEYWTSSLTLEEI